jgi:hypothetical protein
VTVELVGWDQVARVAARVGDACTEAGTRSGVDAARALASQVRPQLPVRTGRLRGSVDTIAVPDGAAMVIGAPYAVYVRAARRAVAAALEPAAADYATRAAAATATEIGRLPWP